MFYKGSLNPEIRASLYERKALLESSIIKLGPIGQKTCVLQWPISILLAVMTCIAGFSKVTF